MAAVSKGHLHNFPENIRSCVDGSTKENPHVYIVVEVQRYLIDPDYKSHTGLDPGGETECYDITISDLSHKRKCLLHPACNHLTQKNIMTPGCCIQVDPGKCRLHCNDLDIDAETFIILEGVEVHGTYSGSINESQIDFCPDCGDREKQCFPLVTNRGNYLPRWNAEDPRGLPWIQLDPKKDGFPRDRTITIERLANQWKRLARPYPVLVVRVLHKSRLRMYGKPYKKEKWPYQLYLGIADDTGACTATIWGALCTDLLYSIDEGSVLVLKSYSVRERFQLMPQPTLRHKDLPTFTIEVGLDKRNPVADVTIVHHCAVRDSWKLPSLKGQFFNRKQMSSLPDQFNCDIVGVVLKISRYFRTRKTTEGAEFWLYRWLYLVDSSSTKPILIHLFSTSQPDVHDNIYPGRVMVLTQARVLHNISSISHSRQQRSLYVTTTNESQVHIHRADQPCAWSGDPAVRAVITWRSTSVCQRLLLWAAAIGGSCDYPPFPDQLQDYKDSHSSDKPLQLVSGSDLKNRLESLHFRETVILNIQCHVVHLRMRYNPKSSSTASLSASGGNAGNQGEYPSPAVHSLRSGRNVQSSNIGASTSKGSRPSTSHDVTAPQEVTIDHSYHRLQELLPDCLSGDVDPLLIPRVYNLSTGGSTVAEHLLMPRGSYCRRAQSTSPEDLGQQPSQDYLTLVCVDLNRQVIFPVHCLVPDPYTPATTLQSQSSFHRDISLKSNQTPEERLQSIRLLLDPARWKDKRLLVVMEAYRHSNRVELLLKSAYQKN